MWYRELLRYVKRPHRWILPGAVAQNGHIVHDGVRPAVAQGLQGRDSEDENFPHGEVLGQARTGSAQIILADQIPASESVRPKPREFVGPPPPATGKLTDSALEDDSVQGRDEEKTGETGTSLRGIINGQWSARPARRFRSAPGNRRARG